MAANQPPGTRTRPPSINKNAADPRTPRAIRFSESEWDRIRIAAAKRGISFGSFVREAALSRAAEDFGDNSTALPPRNRRADQAHVPLCVHLFDSETQRIRQGRAPAGSG